MSSTAPSAPAIVLSLCRHLTLDPQTSFHALLLLTDYLGTSAKHPAAALDSKSGVQGALAAVSVASVLAALPSPHPSTQAVFDAAAVVLGPEFVKLTTPEALEETARAITEEAGPAAPPISTAKHLQRLHSELTATNPLDARTVNLDIAYRLLEALCLAEGGAQCSTVLRRGGSLTAVACLAAAHCINAPRGGGPALLAALAALTGFPAEIIQGQTISVLSKTLD